MSPQAAGAASCRARPVGSLRRGAVLLLAVFLLAGGFVWADTVADIAFDESPAAEAADLLIQPSVDSIYESGSVTYQVTNPAAVERVNWYRLQGFERLFYFRFEIRNGRLGLVQVDWGSIFTTIDSGNCSALTCTVNYTVRRTDKCMEEMDLSGVNYPELGVDFSLRITPVRADVGEYGYPNFVKVSAPLTGDSSVECPKPGTPEPPDNSWDFTSTEGDISVERDDTINGRYVFSVYPDEFCSLLDENGGGGVDGDDGGDDFFDCETSSYSNWRIDGDDYSGFSAPHTFTEPGEYPIVFEADGYNDETDTNHFTRAAGTLTVRAPEIFVKVEADTETAKRAKSGEEFDVTVTASTTKGLGDLSELVFDPSTALDFDPDIFEVVATPSLPAEPLTAAPQSEFYSGTWTLKTKEDGNGETSIAATVNGVDANGLAVTGTGDTKLKAGDPLEVEVVVDPANVPKSAREDGEPVDVKVTITVENTTDRPMTSVSLRSFGLDRVVVGQPVSYELIDPAPVPAGVIALNAPPDPITGISLPNIEPGEKITLQARYRIDDDGEFSVGAVVEAAGHQGGRLTAVGETGLSVAAEKYLEFRTTTVAPSAAQSVLDAGQAIWVRGTIKNVTTTATIEVGPPYAQTSGNAGAQSATWDTVGSDPTDFTPIGTVLLEPGEEKEFTVKVVTSWSDPRPNGGVRRSGGTQANLEFTPWGRATEADGTVTVVTPDLIDAPEDQRKIRISIDDSIAIPRIEPLALTAGIFAGAVEGTAYAGAAIVTGIPDAFIAAYSLLSGASEYQQKIWDSFTEEERNQFVDETSFMILSVLQRNYEYAEQDGAELLAQINASVLGSMTELATEWETGDYVGTAQVYSRYSAEAIGSVMLPIAFTKLAKMPRAAAILARAQAAIQARLAPLAADIARINRVDEAARILKIVEAGAELTPDQIARLYGISPDELAELQRLADKYGLLLTVRSRHSSSIDWIEKFGAMLKPEALKLKTVSDLDTRLGFDDADVGSLVFRKPEALVAHEAGEPLGSAINSYVIGQGFEPGTADWENAIRRVVERADEWKKYEKTYKQLSKNGTIDTSFDYDGNAIPTGIVRDKDLQKTGFRLRQTSADGDPVEVFIVELFDTKTGTWKRVTGDIDPIAFTHTDGSPLDAWQHADLLDDMRASEKLRAQHGESATFVQGGIDFITKQFKPLEAALQIGPGGMLPRVVRFNAAKSRWNDAFDFNLFWDGGAVEMSAPTVTRAQASDFGIPVVEAGAYEAAQAAAKRALKVDEAAAGKNFGSCRLRTSAATAPAAGVGAVYSDELGALQQVQPDGSSAPSDLAQRCFVESNEVIDVDLYAITQIASGIIGGGGGGPQGFRRAPQSVEAFAMPATMRDVTSFASAGDTTLVVEDTNGFNVGDRIAIGVGTTDVELRTLVSVDPFVIDAPLERDHGDGTLVAVVGRADSGPDPTTTTTTTPDPDPTTTTTATTIPVTDPTTATTVPVIDPATTTTTGPVIDPATTTTTDPVTDPATTTTTDPAIDPTTTSSPATSAPTTSSSTTSAPTTSAPMTSAPMTSGPSTSGPTSSSPTAATPPPTSSPPATPTSEAIAADTTAVAATPSTSSSMPVAAGGRPSNTTPRAAAIPTTGSDSANLVVPIGVLLVLLGAAMVLVRRRRLDLDVEQRESSQPR